MSFSGEVKKELSKQIASARHCQIAEIAAIISFCGSVHISEEDQYSLKIHTENIWVAKKYFKLIKSTFHAKTTLAARPNVHLKKGHTYLVIVPQHEDAIRILKATKLLDDSNEIREELSVVDNLVIQQTCCKRAFIRGAFLAAGSLSDPERFYHFEIVCATRKKAEQIKTTIYSFSIEAKIVMRKKYFVVYIKEGSQIVDILNVMEAHVALMNLENIRILKEMRNFVNRKVNCEAANINKTVSAAIKQIEDIEYIRDTAGLDSLSDGLRNVALARLEQPEAALKELGELLDPPVGKSGVNHRLRKIGEIAEKLRDERGEDRQHHR